MPNQPVEPGQPVRRDSLGRRVGEHPVYPPAVKAEAVTRALWEGSSDIAAEQLDIPGRTIRHWMRSADGVELAALVRAKTVEVASEVLLELVDDYRTAELRVRAALAGPFTTASELKSAVVAWAILVDKGLLLTGQVTPGRYSVVQHVSGQAGPVIDVSPLTTNPESER